MCWWQKAAFLVFMVAELAELVSSTLSPAPGPVGPWTGQSGGAAVHVRLVGKRHVRASVAGGDVILGGFALAVVASVLCYVRVTRRKAGNSSSKPEDSV